MPYQNTRLTYSSLARSQMEVMNMQVLGLVRLVLDHVVEIHENGANHSPNDNPFLKGCSLIEDISKSLTKWGVRVEYGIIEDKIEIACIAIDNDPIPPRGPQGISIRSSSFNSPDCVITFYPVMLLKALATDPDGWAYSYSHGCTPLSPGKTPAAILNDNSTARNAGAYPISRPTTSFASSRLVLLVSPRQRSKARIAIYVYSNVLSELEKQICLTETAILKTIKGMIDINPSMKGFTWSIQDLTYLGMQSYEVFTHNILSDVNSSSSLGVSTHQDICNSDDGIEATLETIKRMININPSMNGLTWSLQDLTSLGVQSYEGFAHNILSDVNSSSSLGVSTHQDICNSDDGIEKLGTLVSFAPTAAITMPPIWIDGSTR